MAFLPKDTIVMVLQALPHRNVRYKHRSDRVGAVGVAGSRTVWKKILGRTCAEKMDGKIALDNWGRKVGKKLLI